MLLLLSGRNRFPFTCNPSWGCNLLVVCHGVVFQLVEHLFDSWGCDNHWWDNHWWDNHRWDSLSSLLLEIPINLQPPALKSLSRIFSELFVRPSNLFRIFLETFRPPLKSFQDIFRNFLSATKIFSGYFGQIPRQSFSLFSST